jgi:hypothetical protein
MRMVGFDSLLQSFDFFNYSILPQIISISAPLIDNFPTNLIKLLTGELDVSGFGARSINHPNELLILFSIILLWLE